VTKTDGVPLFVEELTKMVLESEVYRGTTPVLPLPPLAIPATLQDALMARLDRLAPVREIAQVGAVLGREFSYDLVHAVSRLDESALQQGLHQLVEAELVYQRGLPPHATYIFKHALIQDTAYQSLLKSKRQQLHQQIAHVLVERFPQTVETQPELLAHHYTEAGLKEEAIPYWQKAGQSSVSRSANLEAISHLTKGLELLKTLPDTPEHAQQELTLQITLGTPLMAMQGFAALEVEKTYARALELCRRIGETPQLSHVLFALHLFYVVRGEHKTAHKLAVQLLTLAQRVGDPALLLDAYNALGKTFFFFGEFALAQEHLEQGIALYDPRQHNNIMLHAGVSCQGYAAWVLWFLGYPDQALKRALESLTQARELRHPFIIAVAIHYIAQLYQVRRDIEQTREWAEESVTLAIKQGFVQFLATDAMLRGWALAEQGQEEGIIEMRQNLATFRATGAEFAQPFFLAQLAEVCGNVGQLEEGLNLLAEALAAVDKTGERFYEAELYRLRGELTLQKFSVVSHQLSVTDPRPLTPDPHGEAEACFLKAIAVAKKQQAKSLELRATVSLAHLWQTQGKQHEAHRMLANIYNWFTEGFDTKDLQEAKTLLDELS